MPTSFVQKLRYAVCCGSADVDQNEGPPPSPPATAPQAANTAAAMEQPPQQIVPQSVQSTAEASAGFTGEEQPEPIEENWDDEEPEPSPYKPEDFVVEKDQYATYKYDQSPYKTFDDVQKSFDAESQSYRKPDTVDLDTLWGSREYERSIRSWNPEQEFNPAQIRAQTKAR
ncbi:uncharacterized protein ATC70_006425 [Mucor velutinosus]|uniref:Uncharacterized protein n=1 Tax=Mucor velutinosus TaxID=708070 RepID=A0AAN7DNQ3_9FUNG|nr:hypothetical protein ATC70_006425 [Mucor velutinosus]